MRSPEAGTHERMMWMWHTHFATNADKAPALLCWRQLRTFHRHALGNFATLLHEMVTDPALLAYLDAFGSTASDPNENLGRELLELFSMGTGTYTQADVEAAAHCLAGWQLDWEHGTTSVDPASAPRWPVTFLGATRRFTPDQLVDRILEQPSVAPFIVSKVWAELIGGAPEREELDRLSASFRADYEILPLVRRILDTQAFQEPTRRRPRTALEWFVPAISVLTGAPPTDGSQGSNAWSPWDLNNLGQMPYAPPNVNGWPASRWTSPGSLIAKGQFLSWRNLDDQSFLLDLAAAEDPVAAVLDRCSISHASAETVDALRSVYRSVGPEHLTQAAGLTLRFALLSPEFLHP
jgi:uncharacterized protein (DUF1800 family)